MRNTQRTKTTSLFGQHNTISCCANTSWYLTLKRVKRKSWVGRKTMRWKEDSSGHFRESSNYVVRTVQEEKHQARSPQEFLQGIPCCDRQSVRELHWYEAWKIGGGKWYYLRVSHATSTTNKSCWKSADCGIHLPKKKRRFLLSKLKSRNFRTNITNEKTQVKKTDKRSKVMHKPKLKKSS